MPSWYRSERMLAKKSETTVSQVLEALEERKYARYPRTKRNARCPCGSGKKFKRCCLPRVKQAQPE